MMDGEESPYTEFFIERVRDGEDITDSLLNQKGYLFLLVAPHVEQADDSQLDLINQMYEYADEHDYPFYALTASGEKGINFWRDITGAEYPFCQTDEIVLKTIIRSNPGLVLLKDGVIIRKWSHNSLPDEYELTDRLENLEIGKIDKETMAEKILVIVLWYLLPLLLLTIADRLWAWTKWINGKKQSNTDISTFKTKTNNEKENRSRQLEDEPEPARGCGSGQGTE
jgi:triosephosphate isomerase